MIEKFWESLRYTMVCWQLLCRLCVVVVREMRGDLLIQSAEEGERKEERKRGTEDGVVERKRNDEKSCSAEDKSVMIGFFSFLIHLYV